MVQAAEATPYKTQNFRINKEISKKQLESSEDNFDSLKRIKTLNASKIADLTVNLIDKDIMNSKIYQDLSKEKERLHNELDNVQDQLKELQLLNEELEAKLRNQAEHSGTIRSSSIGDEVSMLSLQQEL